MSFRLEVFILKILKISLIIIMIMSGIVAVADQPPIEWLKMQGPDGIEIEYQAGMEESVKKLIPEVQCRLKQYDEAVAKLKNAGNLALKNLDDITKFLAGQLALDIADPNIEALKKDATTVANHITKQLEGFTPNFRHIRMWCPQTASAMLLSGTQIPGLRLNQSTKTPDVIRNSRISASIGYTPSGNIEITSASFDIVCDLTSMVLPDKYEVVAGIDQLDRVLSFYNNLDSNLEESLFHEVIEVQIRRCLSIYCPYARWFCEGVATYLASETIMKFCGKSAADTFLESFDTSVLSSYKDQVDLRYWRDPYWEQNSPYKPDITVTSVAYVFATKEINGLVERHGTEVLPAIFKELLKAPKSVRDDKAILSAIQATTKEDFASILDSYGAKAPKDKFSRFAINQLLLESWPDGSKMIAPDTLSGKPKYYFMKDGEHGVQLVMVYAMPEPPATLKVELVELNESGKERIITTSIKAIADKSSTATLVFKFPNDISRPGNYALKLYLEDRCFRNIDFEVVPDSE